jgi:hypothetical protein
MPNEPGTTDPRNALRALGVRMTRAWAEAATDLAKLPHAADLSFRDFVTLLLLAPGEHVGRPAIENLFGADGADVIIGALCGRGLVAEEPNGVVLTTNGREFLQALVDLRAETTARLLSVLPEDQRQAFLQGMQGLADAVERADTLVEA